MQNIKIYTNVDIPSLEKEKNFSFIIWIHSYLFLEKFFNHSYCLFHEVINFVTIGKEKSNHMEILNHRQIMQKIKRLAIEILERNTAEQELIIAGVNTNGTMFSKLIVDQLTALSDKQITHTYIRVNPTNPLDTPVETGLPIEDFDNRATIVIDDVASSGRTLFYACKPLFNILPKKLETAVLINRTHKSFPIHVDYFGLSLATTLKESIEVIINDKDGHSAILK